MTHIYVSKLTIIVSDNGLSPGRRQAIIWTNAGILLIGPYGTNFSEILLILTFSFTKMSLKVCSAKWRPFCLGLNVLECFLHYFHSDDPTRSQLSYRGMCNFMTPSYPFSFFAQGQCAVLRAFDCALMNALWNELLVSTNSVRGGSPVISRVVWGACSIS